MRFIIVFVLHYLHRLAEEIPQRAADVVGRPAGPSALEAEGLAAIGIPCGIADKSLNFHAFPGGSSPQPTALQKAA